MVIVLIVILMIFGIILQEMNVIVALIVFGEVMVNIALTVILPIIGIILQRLNVIAVLIGSIVRMVIVLAVIGQVIRKM